MTRLRNFLFAATLPLAACAADDLPDAPTDVVADDTTDAATEGRTGTIAVEFPWGVQQERYEIQNGFVVIRGDIIVKRADQLHDRATVRVGGGRWPNSQVRFAFDTGYPASEATRVRNIVAGMEAVLPIDFIEIANPCAFPANACATDYILMRNWTKSSGQSADPNGNGQVGYRGGQQIINTPTGFSTTGYQHELLHALGFFHEQERSDRDSYVKFRPECTQDDKEGNFGKNTDAGERFGSYDFASIMHYNSNGFALPDDERADAPCNNGWPLEVITPTCPIGICSDTNGDGKREFLTRPGNMSTNDIAAVWSMYGTALGAHEAYDAFGRTVVFGDFDGDERDDLAIGMPGEDTVNDTVANAGAIALFKGTVEGFQPWRLYTQSSFGGAEEAYDGFGTALAVGDFNNDGLADLAVGTPAESVGSVTSAGAVYVLKGTPNGLAHLKTVTQTDVGAANEAYDRFGDALAVGDFDHDYKDDLAIGATGEAHGDNIMAGHVFVMRGTGNASALVAWTGISQATLGTAPNAPAGGIITPVPLGTQQPGDMFGSGLAVGRIDDDNIDDLVVAASCDDEMAVCAGGVYLFRGSASGMRGWMRLGQSTGADAGDRFGYAVVTGDVDMDGDADVIVGAPYDDYAGASNVGRVYIAHPTGRLITSMSTMTQASGDAGDGDLFGYSLAFGNDSAFNVFAVGAPGEAWGTGPASGAVFLHRSGESGLSFDKILRAAPSSDELAEDTFGSSVAAFTDAGSDYLIIGDPGEDLGAGAVQSFVASPSFSSMDPTQVLSQTSRGTRAL